MACRGGANIDASGVIPTPSATDKRIMAIAAIAAPDGHRRNHRLNDEPDVRCVGGEIATITVAASLYG
jgi:hypothetical protein